MKDVLKIMLNGAYTNFKRILFAADRVTDMELLNLTRRWMRKHVSVAEVVQMSVQPVQLQ